MNNMDTQEWEEKVKNAKCPDSWTNDQLGFDTDKGIEDTDLTFYPGMSNIETINVLDEEFCYGRVTLYSHGINIYIEPKGSLFENKNVFNFPITNEQIVDIDLVPYDEYVKYKKNLGDYMSRGAGIAAIANTGMVGVAIGAAIGAVASIGNKTTHLKGKYLRITFWERETKELKYILLDHPKQKVLEKFVEDWKSEKKTNEETGRKPTDEAPGCFSIIALVIVSTFLCSFAL